MSTEDRDNALIAKFKANPPKHERKPNRYSAKQLRDKLDTLPRWEAAGYCADTTVASVTSFIANYQNHLMARWRTGGGGGNTTPKPKPKPNVTSSSSSGSDVITDIFGNNDESDSDSDSGAGMIGLFG